MVNVGRMFLCPAKLKLGYCPNLSSMFWRCICGHSCALPNWGSVMVLTRAPKDFEFNPCDVEIHDDYLSYFPLDFLHYKKWTIDAFLWIVFFGLSCFLSFFWFFLRFYIFMFFLLIFPETKKGFVVNWFVSKYVPLGWIQILFLAKCLWFSKNVASFPSSCYCCCGERIFSRNPAYWCLFRMKLSPLRTKCS